MRTLEYQFSNLLESIIDKTNETSMNPIIHNKVAFSQKIEILELIMKHIININKQFNNIPYDVI